MSFEGYYQVLCENGHLYLLDIWDEDITLNTYKCKFCGAKKAFSHTVDQTNDEGIKVIFEIDVPAKFEECHTCGHKKIIELNRYKIPTKDNIKYSKSWEDE